jgi:uncharacterized damage-inducible protein DinB
MPDTTLLEALLDSYQRGNTILLNLLHAMPNGALEARAREDSPSIATQLSHMHSTRLYFLNDTAAEFAQGLSQLFHQESEQRTAERDPHRIAAGLEASAKAVCATIHDRVSTGQPLKGTHTSYDHPVLLLQHLLWHEGYHVGQIKLALKAAGHTMSEENEEQNIWSVWRTETWEEPTP